MPALKKDDGLKVALVYADDKASCFWGWWCRTCSTPTRVVGGEGFKSRDNARRAAARHEDRSH